MSLSRDQLSRMIRRGEFRRAFALGRASFSKHGNIPFWASLLFEIVESSLSRVRRGHVLALVWTVWCLVHLRPLVASFAASAERVREDKPESYPVRSFTAEECGDIASLLLWWRRFAPVEMWMYVQRARTFAESAYRSVREPKDPAPVFAALTLARIGVLEGRLYEEISPHLEFLHTHIPRIGEKNKRARAFTMLAMVYLDLGSREQALDAVSAASVVPGITMYEKDEIFAVRRKIGL